jgi:hypothetical protein
LFNKKISAMRHPLLQALLPALSLAFCLSAEAAEWSVRPEISLRSGFNDNIRLESTPHDSVWETILTPLAQFGVATPRQGISATTSAVIRRFTGGSGTNSSSLLDREDFKVDANAYHGTELGRISLGLQLIDDSTLDSALDTSGEVIQQRATRRLISLAPTWRYSFTEKTLLDVGYRHMNVEYSDEISTNNLVGYDYDVLSASLNHTLDARQQVILSSGYSLYAPDDGFESRTLNLQAGYTRRLSETLSTSFLAGLRITNSDTEIPLGFCTGAVPGATFPTCTGGQAVQTGVIDSSDDTGSVFNINLVRTLDTGNISVNLSRTSTPSSNGGLLDTTQLAFSMDHKFTEKLRTTINLEFYTTETIANTSGSNFKTDDELIRFRPQLTWRWQQDLGITGSYEYARSTDNNTTATRNAVYLTLGYQPSKRSVSR